MHSLRSWQRVVRRLLRYSTVCAVVQITCLTVCYPEYVTPLFPLLTLHYCVGNYVMTLRLEPRTSTIWQTFQSSQITCLTVCYPEYATPLFPLLTLHYSVGNYVMTLRLEPRTSTIWQTFQSSRVLSIYNYANNSTSLLCCIICMKKLWIDRNCVSKQIPFPSFSTEDVALARVYT